MNLWKLLREKMLLHPQQTICEGDSSMTFEEACIYAELLAKQLHEPYYAILCKSEMAAALGLLACIAAGKTAVPIPVRYGEKMYKKFLDKVDPPAVITDFDRELKMVSLHNERLLNNAIPDDVATILFTSGSTGEPKGVMLSHLNLITNICDIASYFEIGTEDTMLISRPLYHSSVLTGEFLTALYKGVNMVFCSDSFQPQKLLNLIEKHKITVFGTTPTLMSLFSRLIGEGKGLPIKVLSISGECMTEGMARRIRKSFPEARIYCGYGLSEASPRVAFLHPEEFNQFPTSLGRPVPSVKIRIVDKHGRDVKKGTVGELLVSGPNVMKGYFKDRKRTQNTVKGKWLYTGDLAMLSKNGQFYIKGRRDDMIIRAGMNVYPAEIENTLSKDPRVSDLLIYRYIKNDTHEIGMKICGLFKDKSEVVKFCETLLPPYQMPSQIELIDHTDMITGGKKKRRLL